MEPAPVSDSDSGSKALRAAIAASLLLVIVGFPVTQAGHEIFVDHERPQVLDLFTRAPTKVNLHAWDDAAKDRSIFAKAIRPVVLQFRYDFLRDYGSKALGGHDDWLFYRPDVDYLLQPGFDDPRFYKDTYDTLVDGKWVNPRNPMVAIRRFHDQLAARGIALLVIPISGKPSLQPERLSDAFTDGFASAPPSPTRRLLDSLQGAGIATLDLRGVLLEAKARNGGPIYLRRDTHWLPSGLQPAAAAIAKAIRNLPVTGWADASRPNRYSLRPVSANRFGDIAEMTKIPDRAKRFAPEKVAAEQVLDSTTGQPYRDDPHSPILWLGDSFSRIYQTDEPRSAGLIAHLAHELGLPLASIVNDGGASTVVRQQLLRHADLLRDKKIVVWSFVERDIRFGSNGWEVLDLPTE